MSQQNRNVIGRRSRIGAKTSYENCWTVVDESNVVCDTIMGLKMTMNTVNTADFKTQANRLLKRIARDQIIITRRGHPCAALVPGSDETLVDLLWEYSPEAQRRLRIASHELQSGRYRIVYARRETLYIVWAVFAKPST